MTVKEPVKNPVRAQIQQANKPAQSDQDNISVPVMPPLLMQRARQQPAHLTPQDALVLQRLVNNNTVTQLLTRDRAAEALAGGSEPNQDRPNEEPRITAHEVTATLRKGSYIPAIRLGGFTPAPDALVAHEMVSPTGGPSLTSGGNDCIPASEALDWEVVDEGEDWRPDVCSLTVSGEVRVTPWPNNPNSMTVPNTPNPVDGGNINNEPGSPNQWETVIADLEDYDTPGVGGAGENWHSTEITSAHEWRHWYFDYLDDALPSGNWDLANREIDALRESKSARRNEASARNALAPRVRERMSWFVFETSRRWHEIIHQTDMPGAGGQGYTGGMNVINRIINSIRAYAAQKGWIAGSNRPRRRAGD